jgi:hypothetical protein
LPADPLLAADLLPAAVLPPAAFGVRALLFCTGRAYMRPAQSQTQQAPEC